MSPLLSTVRRGSPRGDVEESPDGRRLLQGVNPQARQWFTPGTAKGARDRLRRPPGERRWTGGIERGRCHGIAPIGRPRRLQRGSRRAREGGSRPSADPYVALTAIAP